MPPPTQLWETTWPWGRETFRSVLPAPGPEGGNSNVQLRGRHVRTAGPVATGQERRGRWLGLTTSRRSSGGRRADINPAYGDALLMGIGEAEALANEETVFAAVRHLASLEDAGNDRWLGSAIRPYLKTAPLDIVTLTRNRMLSSPDPSDDGSPIWSDDGSGRRFADIMTFGINTARGALADALADLLVYDSDGARTAVAAPALDQIADDPSLPVRACRPPHRKRSRAGCTGGDKSILEAAGRRRRTPGDSACTATAHLLR
jgi:hypothetical protein